MSRWNYLVGDPQLNCLKLSSQSRWLYAICQRNEKVPSAFVMCPMTVMVVIALLYHLIPTLIACFSMWEIWAKLFHLQLSGYKCRPNLSYCQIWWWLRAWRIWHIGRGLRDLGLFSLESWRLRGILSTWINTWWEVVKKFQ